MGNPIPLKIESSEKRVVTVSAHGLRLTTHMATVQPLTKKTQDFLMTAED